MALEGELHPPWLGDRDAVLAALLAFLDEHDAARPDPAARADGAGETSPLSAREAQVLSLVADGLSDGRDRRAPDRLPAHRPPPRGQHPHQAQPALPCRRGRARGPAGPDLKRPARREPGSRRATQGPRGTSSRPRARPAATARGAPPGHRVGAHRVQIGGTGLREHRVTPGGLERGERFSQGGEPRAVLAGGRRIGGDVAVITSTHDASLRATDVGVRG